MILLFNVLVESLCFLGQELHSTGREHVVVLIPLLQGVRGFSNYLDFVSAGRRSLEESVHLVILVFIYKYTG